MNDVCNHQENPSATGEVPESPDDAFQRIFGRYRHDDDASDLSIQCDLHTDLASIPSTLENPLDLLFPETEQVSLAEELNMPELDDSGMFMSGGKPPETESE